MGWAFCGGLWERRNLFCPPGGALFPHRKSTQKRAKTKVLESFPANKRGIYRTMSNCRIDFRSAPLPLIVQNCRCIRLTFGTMWASPRDRRNSSYISHQQWQRQRRRERFYISCPLHSTPKRVGLTPTTCNVRGARRKSRNHPVSGGVFFILFAAVGKKYVAKGIPIPIPKKLKKPES